MDQQKIGSFLKELRKEQGLTQEQLAEHFYISSRTVSRWETGSNMPDVSILVEIADFYDVDLREIFDGERKGERMDKKFEETVLKVADYSNEEKLRITKKLHLFSWVGVIAFVVFLVLDAMGLADSGITKDIASFCTGIAFAMLIVAVIYSSNYMAKIRAIKMRLLRRQ